MTGDERRRRREAALRGLGLVPPPTTLVRRSLADAVRRAEVARRAAPDAGRPAGEVDALDAGCGDRSALARFRPRLGRLVGADLEEPRSGVPAYFDEFVATDLCTIPGTFPASSFDVVLSAFTVEHLVDPPAAFANIGRWLRPGGTLVLTTVNRRHPFVAAYLRLPDPLRARLQPWVKDATEDTHRLVGACNDPTALRDALGKAGFVEIRIRTVDNLARAWGRRRLSFLAGVVGDLLVRGRPSRRSTLVVVARTPERSA